ncbi:hypothetical protein H5410_014633 [Solanum commersonii]|uniref:Uncharacterized protein n=1 Tax=Solanum commersonii TaxID=4109 RepID=A0A9J5ZRH0_SOLCO|nr:hypothetical protein H5410_014633 [Solanum commersonii]
MAPIVIKNNQLVICRISLISFGESDLLLPGHIYVHPRWSNITNSLLPHVHGEQLEYKSNANVCKVFDELPGRYKDSNPLCRSSKLIELSISPNDLVNSVSRLAVVSCCNDDAKNEDKNDEEDIVTIRDEP